MKSREAIDSLRDVVDLMPRDSQARQLVSHAMVLGMAGISVERVLRLEVRDQDDVAGVVDAAGVQADLEVLQARDPTAQAFELCLHELASFGAFHGVRALDTPHDDVPDHRAASA